MGREACRFWLFEMDIVRRSLVQGELAMFVPPPASGNPRAAEVRSAERV